ncbi:hypothetical protein PHYC_02084 [Phycisphaerales bacterium]|nr:hypothetical protein PHYC_02084 [Phycisphaerales bacterium]
MKSATSNSNSSRGFTLLEMLVSVLLIGIVMALVISGTLAVTRAAKGAAERAAINNIKAGLTQFQQEFGFPPPLVKEMAGTSEPPVGAIPPAAGNWTPPTPPIIVGSGSNPSRIAVYVPADAADLRTPTLAPTPTNPLRDNRYSELSLAYYLAGALDVKLNNGANAPMIDGIAGPGMFRPNRDGTFDVPADIAAGRTNTIQSMNRAGTKYGSMINLGKAPKLFTEPAPTTPGIVRVLDSKGVPIRYYRWLQGRPYPGEGFQVKAITDMNVPPIIARDTADANFRYFKATPARDLEQNSAARGATWAIVSAGPNGAFGDEPVVLLAARFGKSTFAGLDEEMRFRVLAEEDNIVEVGQ